jgi:hypothetical protein
MNLTGLVAVAGWAGVAILLLFWRSFIPEYLKEKGKNLATKEDLDDLVKQVQAVTTATKEIENKLSHDVWNRQKQWEMKREVLFDLTKSMTSASDALTEVYSFYDTERKRTGPMPPARQEKELRLGATFSDAASAFDNVTVLSGIVCGESLQKAAVQFGIFLREAKMEAKDLPEFPAKQLTELAVKRNAVTTEIRRVLGLEGSEPPKLTA